MDLKKKNMSAFLKNLRRCTKFDTQRFAADIKLFSVIHLSHE